MSQGADTGNTSSTSEEETQGNAKGPNFRRYGHYRKPPYPYESSLEGNKYGAQLFGMNMEDNMPTTKILNSISVNAVFDQVFKADPTQEAPGVHKKMPFERGYKMFGEREIVVIFK